MAYKLTDLTVAALLVVGLVLELVACTIPAWSNRSYLTPELSLATERIGLWRTCTFANGTNQWSDTAARGSTNCRGLVGATRGLSLAMLIFMTLAVVTLLTASATEWRCPGHLSVVFIVVAMILGLCCWSCWLAFSSRAECDMDQSSVGAAFGLTVATFVFLLLCSIFSVFVALTTDGFGFTKDWSGRSMLHKGLGYDSPPRSQHGTEETYRVPTPPVQFRPLATSLPPRAQLYHVGEDLDSPHSPASLRLAGLPTQSTHLPTVPTARSAPPAVL